MENSKLAVIKEDILKINEIKDLKPLYLYISRSSSILEEKTDAFKKFLKGKINFESDFKIFYAGPEMDESDFINFVKTPSFFSEGRVAVVKNIEKASAEFIKILISMFEQSALHGQGTVVILTYLPGEKRARNLTEFMALAQRCGTVENLYAPTAEKLSKWLAEKSELDGIKFTQKAASRFIENVNFDLNILKSEYEKLLIYLSSEKEKVISEVAVDKLVSRIYDMKIFDLVDCIGNRDRAGALKALKPLALEKQNMIGIITLLHRMFSSFIYIKSSNIKNNAAGPTSGSADKSNERKIDSFKDFIEKSIGHAKNKEKIAANYLRFSKKYSVPEVIKVFDILNRYDILLRAAEINESMLVTKLIAEITGVSA
jgi:DNA polymerase III delta subunit